MNIRSITAFVEVGYPVNPDIPAKAGEAVRALRAALTQAGITVQTARLAIQPFPLALGSAGPGKAVELAKDIQALAFVNEFDYVALGPVRLDDPPAYVEAIPTILAETESVFAGVEIATAGQGISLSRTRRIARIIQRVAVLSPDGFANLRLGALANVGAWSPFFPAGFHGGGGPRIAIATESADVAVKAVTGAATLDDARTRLIAAIEVEARRIEAIVKKVLAKTGVEFQGFDFSLAPFPDEDRSIGIALERLGLPSLGSPGSLMASTFLTDALDRATFKRTGFCGLMLPVLEDTILAQRTVEGMVTINELLAYSAVCGTGLDCIPLPGDIAEGVLIGILLDVAALALRLNKPLTARLMPLPGKQAGDATDFTFEFFANSSVMQPKGRGVEGLLAGDGRVMISPRQK